MSEPGVSRLNVADLVLDLDLQSRAAMNQGKIDEYAEAFQAWDDEGEAPQFPPIDVHEVEGRLLVSDGFHRVEGARKAGRISILARVHPNSTREAVIFASAGANKTHGLPRSNADKRRAVEKILDTDKGAMWSDREIARWCGVSHPLVSKVREELVSTGNITSQTTRAGRDGRLIETANIGRTRDREDLTYEERREALVECEARIEKQLPNLQRLLDDLTEMRDRKVYRAKFATFEEFLESEIEAGFWYLKYLDLTKLGTKLTSTLALFSLDFLDDPEFLRQHEESLTDKH